MYYDAYFGVYPRSELHQVSSTDITVPLGQLVIATHVRRTCPDAVVRVFYGEATDEREICAEITRIGHGCHRSLVGLTLNAGSTGNALRLAKHFHKLGMDVIFGGPEVCLGYQEHGDLILHDKPYLRGVAIGAGDHIVARVVQNGWSSTIPNLIFREPRSGDIIYGPAAPTELDFASAAIDYSLLHDIERCSGVSYLWRTDCHLAKGARCYFCGRMELGFGERPAANVWRELRQVRDNWGITRYYNAADSVAVNRRSLREFVAAQPADFRDEIHRCFINSHQVTPETVSYLRRLNAIAALGIESYALFEAVGKRRATVEINDRALRMLDEEGVPMVISFVLGLPNETEQSIAETGEYIEELVGRHQNIVSVEMSPLTVTSGTRAYKDLMKRMRSRFENRYPPYDIIELSECYFDVCCKIGRSDTLALAADIAHRVRRTRAGIWVDVKGLTPSERESIFSGVVVGNEGQPYSEQQTPVNGMSRNVIHRLSVKVPTALDNGHRCPSILRTSDAK